MYSSSFVKNTLRISQRETAGWGGLLGSQMWNFFVLIICQPLGPSMHITNNEAHATVIVHKFHSIGLLESFHMWSDSVSNLLSQKASWHQLAQSPSLITWLVFMGWPALILKLKLEIYHKVPHFDFNCPPWRRANTFYKLGTSKSFRSTFLEKKGESLVI